MRRMVKKRTILASIVIFSVLLGNYLLASSIISYNATNNDNILTLPNQDPIASAGHESITIQGTNQTVKYAANRSASVPNTLASNDLDLPSISSDSRLTAVNSTFQFELASFESNHTIEDDSGYNIPFSKVSNVSHSSVSVITGTPQNSDTNLNTGNEPPWTVSSSSQEINITLGYNMGSLTYPNALRFDVILNATFSENVNMDIYFFDHHNGNGWVKKNDQPIQYDNDELTYSVFDYIDEHSQSLFNQTEGILNISLVVSSSIEFVANFYTAKITGYRARDVEISAEDWIALSFDLRGSAVVDGFWLWIRSINLTYSDTLNIRLYKNNNSAITLDQIVNGSTFYHEPDFGQFIDNVSPISDYSGDSLSFFQLSTPQSLTMGNYFIVINSSASPSPDKTRYSILTLPDSGDATTDPDNNNDHTLLRRNSTTNWQELKVSIGGVNRRIDAAPFLVEMTRGITPTDLEIKIEGIQVQDSKMDYTEPYSSTNYEWGKGDLFTEDLGVDASGSFYNLNLTWNTGKMPDFTYNCTVENMHAYAREPSITHVFISDQEITWNITYDFNRSKFVDWTGIEFSFTFPSDWTGINLTFPDNKNYFNSSLISPSSNTKNEYLISEEIILDELLPAEQEGEYVIHFSSPNYLDSLNTYLSYSNEQYRAQSFMNGDNMSATMVVQSSYGKAVATGNVNLTLYNPSNSPLTTISTSTINNSLNFKTTYNFGGSTLYTFNSGDPIGKYLLVGYWFNGSECGINFYDIYKVNYSVTGFNIRELYDTGENQLYGTFSSGVSQSIPTNIFHVSVDQINKEELNIQPNLNNSNVNFTKFIQTETLFNPGEEINFSVEIKSLDLSFTHEVNVWVEIYQTTQDDRIIIRESTNSPVNLNFTGGTGSNQVINLTTIFPTNMDGYLAPIRHTLYKTRVGIEIDGNDEIVWTSNDTYSTILEDNATDGSIISVRDRYNRTGNTFSQVFDRDTETLFNQETLYLLMLESNDGTALENLITKTFTNNMQSYFANTTITPAEGSQFTMNNDIILNGSLFLENNTIFPNNTIIEAWLYNNTVNAWIEYPTTTNTSSNQIQVMNGTFNATFVLPSVYQAEMEMKLNWTGVSSEIGAATKLITVNITNYISMCEITINPQKIEILGDSKNFFTFSVKNTGNSTLIFKEQPSLLESSSTLSIRISEWLLNEDLNLLPNESFIFKALLLSPDPGLGKEIDINFTILINANSAQIKTQVEFVQDFTGVVKPVDLLTRLGEIWYVGLFAIIGILGYIAIVNLGKTRKLAKKPVSEGKLAMEKKSKMEKGAKPYKVQKASDISPDTEEKKYRSVDEVMKEIKGEGED